MQDEQQGRQRHHEIADAAVAQPRRVEDVVPCRTLGATGDARQFGERAAPLLRVGARLELRGVWKAERRQGEDVPGRQAHGSEIVAGAVQREASLERVRVDPCQIEPLRRGVLARGDDRRRGTARLFGGIAGAIRVEFHADDRFGTATIQRGLHADRRVAAEQPAGDAHREGAEITPAAQAGGEFAIHFRRERGDASEPAMPEGEHRRLIVVRRYRPECRARPQVTQVVAVDGGKRGCGQFAEQHHVGERARRGPVGDEARSCDGDRLLREEARQLLDVRGEQRPASSAFGDIFEEGAVDVGLLAKADDADADPDRAEPLQQPHVFTRLLRVGGIGEQHDVARALVRLLDEIGRGDQSGVGEDPATAGLDPAHRAADTVLIVGRGERRHHVRGAVDGNDGHLVEWPERVDRGARAEIRQIHLRAAVRHRHQHAARAVEHDGHRERQLAVFVLDLHGHRQVRIDVRSEVPADAERRPPAGKEQPATELVRIAREVGQTVRAELLRRHVLDDHGAEGLQVGELARHLCRRCDAQAHPSARERSTEIVRRSGAVDEQDRRRRLDAHGSFPAVVLGHAIGGGVDPQLITREAGTLDDVTERELRRTRPELLAPARDLDAIAQQHGVALEGSIGSHPRAELKRFAFIDAAGQVERLDGDIGASGARGGADVYRNAARRRFVRGHRHRRTGGLAVRQHDDASRTLRRDEARGERHGAAQIAAVRIDLLDECLGGAEGLGQLLHARLPAEEHDADAVASAPGLLQQADDLEGARARILRHRARDVGDDDDVHAAVADTRERHRRQQDEEHQDRDADRIAER